MNKLSILFLMLFIVPILSIANDSTPQLSMIGEKDYQQVFDCEKGFYFVKELNANSKYGFKGSDILYKGTKGTWLFNIKEDLNKCPNNQFKNVELSFDIIADDHNTDISNYKYDLIINEVKISPRKTLRHGEFKNGRFNNWFGYRLNIAHSTKGIYSITIKNTSQDVEENDWIAVDRIQLKFDQ